MDERLSGVLTEIRSLLAVPDAERPSRAAVEEMLTNGYAYALALEGERLRTEERLRTTLRTRTGVKLSVREEEIAELTEHRGHRSGARGRARSPLVAARSSETL